LRRLDVYSILCKILRHATGGDDDAYRVLQLMRSKIRLNFVSDLGFQNHEYQILKQILGGGSGWRSPLDINANGELHLRSPVEAHHPLLILWDPLWERNRDRQVPGRGGRQICRNDRLKCRFDRFGGYRNDSFFYKMLYWINWIVLLSLEPLAGELEYASVEWSAAGAWVGRVSNV
jgi:hypothetical protein